MLAIKNGRVWLDKAQLQEVYGAFAEQKFYSVEYLGDDVESVKTLATVVAHFQEWAKEAYLQARMGNPTPPLTEPLAIIAYSLENFDDLQAEAGEITELAATLAETRGELVLAEDKLAICAKERQLQNEDINTLTKALHDVQGEITERALTLTEAQEENVMLADALHDMREEITSGKDQQDAGTEEG
jgi:hypothetical protein